jgi:protease I
MLPDENDLGTGCQEESAKTRSRNRRDRSTGEEIACHHYYTGQQGECCSTGKRLFRHATFCRNQRSRDEAGVLPSGVMNPDHLRMDPMAVSFVRDFVATGRPVAAICHGPWILIDAGVVKGKTFTSWPSLKTDLKNAGANWVDKEVVTDGQFISSRKPDDIPAFSKALIEAVGGMKAKAA